uniref:Ig-like domain-containing protein n=1 Tax=Varanus komodoensis TaxID=61221 RepID=A0A8D2L3V9_VARKO
GAETRKQGPASMPLSSACWTFCNTGASRFCAVGEGQAKPGEALSFSPMREAKPTTSGQAGKINFSMCCMENNYTGENYSIQDERSVLKNPMPFCFSSLLDPQRSPSLFPLIPQEVGSTNIDIGCWATDFYSGSITFSWKDYRNDSGNAINFMTFPSVFYSETFSASSSARVPVAEWKSCSPFYCSAGDKTVKVVHPSKFGLCYSICHQKQPGPFGEVYLYGSRRGRGLAWSTLAPGVSKPLGIILFVCRYCATGDNSYPNVNVETIRPSFADIFKKDSAKLTCKLSNVPSHANFSSLDVTWTQGLNKKPLETKLGQPMDQENGLQYIEATATVYTAEWNSGETFTCKVDFPGILPKPVEKSMKNSPPSVYILPPPTEELALKETATLTCLANNFYPNEVLVQWLQNNQPVSRSKYITSKPTQESEKQNSYYVYSKLTISEQDWSNNDQFTCVVGHEALPLYTTQKTIDKTMGKPAVINVSLQFSDTLTTCY